MGRASRSKRSEERDKLAQIAAQQLDARKAKLWAGPVLKEVLPPGAEPMATRYDPMTDCYHVACTDGEVHHILRANLEAAERRVIDQPLVVWPDAPMIHGPNLRKTADRMRQQLLHEMRETRQQMLEQAQRDEERRQQQMREELKQQPQPQDAPQTAEEKWDLARARCAEGLKAVASKDPNAPNIFEECECYANHCDHDATRCKEPSAVLFRPCYANPEGLVGWALCEACAVREVSGDPRGLALLDCDPDA